VRASLFGTNLVQRLATAIGGTECGEGLRNASRPHDPPSRRRAASCGASASSAAICFF